jgi:transcriptional regulator with XRE-family HTH domain
MSSPADYIAQAMEAQQITSQNQLAKRLGVSHPVVSEIASGKMPPSERITLQLAEMAGIDERKALLDRMTWVAKDDHARKVYAKLAKTFAIVTMMTGTPGGPPATPGAIAASPPRQVFAKETDREQIGRVGVLLYIMKHWLKSILSFTRALQAAPTI